MCAVSLTMDKWRIYKIKFEKHEVIKHDVIPYNAIQAIKFGNLKLEEKIPTHPPWMWKRKA